MILLVVTHVGKCLSHLLYHFIQIKFRNCNKGVRQMRQNHSWDLVALVIKLPFLFFEKCNVSYQRVFLLFVYTPYFAVFDVAARAYLLGYNCADEKELEDALRFC